MYYYQFLNNYDDYLLDISKITISFSQSAKELQNLPFCFTYQKILNKYKFSLRQENFIIFTSIFQLKQFKNIIQIIFMNGILNLSKKLLSNL